MNADSAATAMNLRIEMHYERKENRKSIYFEAIKLNRSSRRAPLQVNRKTTQEASYCAHEQRVFEANSMCDDDNRGGICRARRVSTASLRRGKVASAIIVGVNRLGPLAHCNPS